VISIGKITSVEQAVRYLRQAIAEQRIDYYTARGESPGRWTGHGAEALGLHGEVTDADFTAVLSGRHPRTGEELGRHWGAQKVVAFDIAVSAPKDVSILYALGDERTRQTILRVHDEGVRAATGYLQDHAGWARQRNAETKKIEAVPAQLVMPEFVHRTARPVTDPVTGEVTVDPQLHSHVTVPSWVQRPDGSWSQLHSDALYRHAAAAGAIAQAVWRDGLVRELGVETTVDGKGCFAIVGISNEQRREFSRRTRQIEMLEQALGVDSLYGHKVAVVSTREGKDEVAPTTDLFAQWRQRGAAVGLDASTITTVMQRQCDPLATRYLDVERIAQIVDCRGLTQQHATFSRRDLIRAVASHAPLGMSRQQLEATADAILRDRELVRPLAPVQQPRETVPMAMERWTATGHELRYTTPEMLALETRMVETGFRRTLAHVGMAGGTETQAAISSRPSLTRDQRRMVERVCLSPAGIVVIEGSGGVGKTYALDVCREAFAASDVPVIGCALAGRAADVLEEGSHIRTWTVTGMVNELHQEPLPRGGVLIVDEAGMLGDRQLAELVSLAARDEVKLVLVGDPCQLQPIEAGSPMRTLARHLGSLEVRENIRQQARWERQALERLRQGEARPAYELYRDQGRIHIAEDVTERRQQVVRDHAALAEQGVDAVILAHRRNEVALLNELVRKAEVDAGRVQGPALIVGGKEYQAGDRVLCLANDRSKGLTNGTRGTVRVVDTEQRTLTLERSDGREAVIDTARYDAIDRGYALTVHKAQGMTAEVALVLGSEGAGREWAYTAMSRGNQATHYYEVDRAPEHDRQGVHHHPTPVEEPEARIVRAWERSTEKESALDYPERYAAEREHEPTPDRASRRLATEAQRALLADLGGPDLDVRATWVEASLEIDRSGQRTGAAAASLARRNGPADCAHRRADQGCAGNDRAIARCSCDRRGRAATQSRTGADAVIAGAAGPVRPHGTGDPDRSQPDTLMAPTRTVTRVRELTAWVAELDTVCAAISKEIAALRPQPR
jgi:conjugative relaxase-like TrwC/TraI family protein